MLTDLACANKSAVKQTALEALACAQNSIPTHPPELSLTGEPQGLICSSMEVLVRRGPVSMCLQAKRLSKRLMSGAKTPATQLALSSPLPSPHVATAVHHGVGWRRHS